MAVLAQLLAPLNVALFTLGNDHVTVAGLLGQDDGLREGDLTVRAAVTGWFAAALTAAGHSWVLLTGGVEDRLALAVRVTGQALRRRARFGPAITGALPEAHR